MKGKPALVAAIVIGALLIGGAVWMVARTGSRRPPPSAQAAAPPLPPRPSELSLPGKIRAQQVVNVGPPEAGTIGALFHDVGEQVFEGQLLARLSSQGIETQSQLAAQELEAAQGRVHVLESAILAGRLEASRARADATRARFEFDRADRAYQRQQTLFREGATPRLTYERAQREFQMARTEFKTVDDVATRAEARVTETMKELDAARRVVTEKTDEVENAKSRLAAGEVVSPVDGIIIGRNGQVGELIQPGRGDFFQIATNLTHLEVALDANPGATAQVRAGQPALILVADQASDGILGVVKGFQDDQAVVAFTNPNPAIKPGMTAQVRIKLN